jgi:hypothetical protein
MCAAASAIAVLFRTDAVLVGLILGVDIVRNRSRLSKHELIRVAAILVATLVVGQIVVWLVFGSLLPVTLAAKRAQGLMAISQPFWKGLYTAIYAWWGDLAPHRVGLGLVAIGIISAIVRRSPAMLMVAWDALYYVSYSLLGVSAYHWYYAPLVPVWVILMGAGVDAMTMLSRMVGTRLGFPWIASVVCGLCLVVLVFLHWRQTWLTGLQVDNRYQIYQAAGDWLRLSTPPSASVGALEIGIIGYYGERKMIDFAGLLQPDVAAQMRCETTYQDTALYAVQNYQPDYVVIGRGWLPILEMELNDRCSVVNILNAGDYAYNTDLITYRCRA